MLFHQRAHASWSAVTKARGVTLASAGVLTLVALTAVRAALPGNTSVARLNAVRLAGQQIRLSWPAEATGFILEEASAVGKSPVWTPVASAPLADPSGFHVVISAGSGIRFFRLRQAQADQLTRIAESSPAAGEGSVSVTRETIIRLTAPLAGSAAVGNDRLYAEFGGRKLLTRVQLSSDRRTLTLFYLEPLPGSARVRVTFLGDGLNDERGRALDLDGDGQPGGVATIDFDTLSLTPVLSTAVCGRVFASELAASPNGQSVNVPLAGVTITVDGMEETLRAVTDQNGDFRLEPAPAGDFFVHVDGRTAIRTAENNFPRDAYYPFVGKKWTSIAGEEVNIGNIYLPLIAAGSLQPVSASQDTLVTFPSAVLTQHPNLAGVSITIPANALLNDAGLRGGMVGIAPVPPDRLPSPLPPGLDFPLVITVQTDGPSNLDVPAPVCFPNLPDPVTGQVKAPGAPSALWSFNHDIGDWEVVGPMTVSADGKLVCTDPGVGIRQPGWHSEDAGSPGSGGSTRGGRPRDPTRPRNGSQECAHNDCPCEGNCRAGREVYLQTGEEVMTITDLTIPGRAGMDFVMERTYRSQLEYDGPIGFGWNFRYNETLFFEPNGDVVRYTGRSHEGRWRRNEDGSYTAPPGYFGFLQRTDDGLYTLIESDGFQRLYREDGRLICHQDRFNNRMLFDYDARGNLHRVIDVFGREIQFVFETAGDGVDRLARIEDFMGRQVRYQYDRNGDLVSVTTPVIEGTSTGNDFPNGRTERYTYSSGFARPELNHNILSLTAPEEVARGGPPRLQWTYGTDPSNPMLLDRVLSETEGGTNASGVPAGGTRTFEYAMLNENAPPGQLELPRGRARITERNGTIKEYFVNERQLHIITREFTNGSRPGEPEFYETRSYFDDDGQLIRRVFPEGNETRYTYDSSGPRRSRSNLMEVRHVADSDRGGGNDLVTSYTYEPLFNQVSTMTEPRGNDSSFTPPLGEGGAARYTKRFFYDYQESAGPIPLAGLFEVDLSVIPRGLGDLNGDGRTDQMFGNPVRIEAPDVLLRSGSNEAVRLGSTTQEIISQMQWNDHGQEVARIDPEGNVIEHLYYPDDDPDGDGIKTFSAYTALTGQPIGYLKATVVDGRSSPRRRPDGPAPVSLTTTYLYDPAGNIIGVLDPRGVWTDIEVNALNEIVTLTRGADVSAAVQARQLLTGEQPFRYRTRFHYDQNGRVIRKEVENKDSNTPEVGEFVDQTFAFDILDNLIMQSQEIDATTSLVTKYVYDPNELLVTATQPAGNSRQVAYDGRNLPFTITRGAGSPEASTIQLDYDGNANRIRIVDAEDQDGDGRRGLISYRYDGFDRLIEVTDPLGNQELIGYDAASQPVRSRKFGHPSGPPGTPNVLLEDTILAYDEVGRVFRTDQSLFMAEGSTPSRPVQLVDANADGFVTTFHEFDALSRVTHLVEDDGETSRIIYDGAGRPTATIDAAGNRTTTEFDRNSNPIRVTQHEVALDASVPPETFTTIYTYDQLDRLVRASDNAGQTTRFGYDSRNNLVFRSDPEGPATTDPLGLMASINGPGNTATFVYDGASRLIRVASDLRQGGTGSGAVDTANPFNPDGQVSLVYRWDGNSRLIGITDDNGNRTSYSHDSLDRRIRQVNADGTVHSFLFDRDDNIVQFSDPNGTVVRRTYDELDRVTRSEVTVPSVGVPGTRRETYEYDGLSRLTRATDDNGDATRTQDFVRVYDSLSRVVEERQNGRALSSSWAGDDKRLSLAYPGGRLVQQTFDAIDRVRSLSESAGPIAQFAWIGGGYRELSQLNGNGTRQTMLNDAANQNAGYDGVKRLIRHRVLSPDGASAILDREYGYNRADQRLFEKRNDDFGLTDDYFYDSIYRITRTELDDAGSAGARSRNVATLQYALDGVGNRRQLIETLVNQNSVTANYTVNEVNEYTGIGTSALAYSANGNLTDDGQRLYAYDYRNRLVAVTRKSDGAPIAQYQYDAANRRRVKVTFRPDVPGQVASQTFFYYDGWQLIEEQNAAGATVVTYIHDPSFIDSIVQMQRTPNHPLGPGTFYLHQNSRFDVIAVTDASGNIVEKRFYDDFGRITDAAKAPAESSATGNARAFQGQYLDAETGFYYYRERFYDPELGRFLQRDPVWDPLNFGNQYTFVGNSPVTGLDPYGLDGGTRTRPPAQGQTRTRPQTPSAPMPQVHEAVRDVTDLARIPLQLGGPYGYSKWAKTALLYGAYDEAFKAALFTSNMYDPTAFRGAGNGKVLDRLSALGKQIKNGPPNFRAPSASQLQAIKTTKTMAQAGSALQAAQVAAQGYEYYQKDQRLKQLSASERDRILAEYDRLAKEALKVSDPCLRDKLLKDLRDNMEYQLNNVTDSQITEHLINGAVFLRDSLSTFIPLPTGWLWGNSAEERGRPR